MQSECIKESSGIILNNATKESPNVALLTALTRLQKEAVTLIFFDSLPATQAGSLCGLCDFCCRFHAHPVAYP